MTRRFILILILFLVFGFVVFKTKISIAPLDPNPESIIGSFNSTDNKYRVDIFAYEGDATSANELNIEAVNIESNETETLLTKKVFTGADLYWIDNRNFCLVLNEQKRSQLVDSCEGEYIERLKLPD